MGFLLCALSTCLIAFAIADNNCPSPETIAPCKCDGEGVSCIGAISIEQIRRTFRATYKDTFIRSVWIQGAQMTDLPADIFYGLKIEHFYIELMNMTTIHQTQAFWFSTPAIIKTISLFGNKLNWLPYANLRAYRNLRVLNAGRNEIPYVENHAFDQPLLTMLILAENKITTVGTNAFTALESLEVLDLSHNLMTTLGWQALLCKSVFPDLEINLGNNQISSVDKLAFATITPQTLYLEKNKLSSLPYDSFIDVISRMAQKDGVIKVSDNTFTCRGCDYTWIVQNKKTTLRMLEGFKCPDGNGIEKLTLSNIAC